MVQAVKDQIMNSDMTQLELIGPSGGRVGEGLPVPPHARAHVTTHTENPPPSSPARIRIGETAVWRACPRCRRHVLAAVVSGLLTNCDPENLTVSGELAARIQDRLTFDVHVYGLPQRMRFAYRCTDRIRADRKYPVVAEHRCGSELPAERFTGEMTEIVVSYRRELPDVPPF